MFKYGLNGIKLSYKKGKLMLLTIFGIIAILISYLLGVTQYEWLFIIFSILYIFTLEMVNTAIELTCNMIDSNKNEHIKEIKDISAGAVFLSAIAIFIIACIIFIPRLVERI
jgi:diacylglycerol kinase